MSLHLRYILLSLFFSGSLFFSIPTLAQHCGTTEYNKLLRQRLNITDTDKHFEQWLAKALKNDYHLRQEAEIINIPVVFHVIHNGEAYGTGINITDEQILSQLIILNEDFRRLNPDRDNTPEIFQPVASDLEFTFSIAQRDPEGLPTDGIVRLNGGRALWELIDDFELKSLSHWPPEQYLNIYVTDIGSDYLGYAQFPFSPLEGLDFASNSSFTDGIVLDYRATGSEQIFPAGNYNPKYNLGRTATHEIGHYLGLRHIWGDGGCSEDDYCADTPQQGSSNVGLSDCSFPGRNSCNTGSDDLPDMFMNFMDYTNDVCMNLFTLDQKARTRVVMAGSPRRAELQSSLGALPPVTASNDLGIRAILNPTFSVCGSTTDVVVEVRNYGDNTINSFELTLSNGITIINHSENLPLQPSEIDTVTISGLQIPNEAFELKAEIVAVNGGSDGNNENNIKTNLLKVPQSIVELMPLTFDRPAEAWSIYNDDELRTWSIITTDTDESVLFLNFYDYEDPAIDFFSSPAFSLLDDTSASLRFDVAYANYPQVEGEGLLITIGEQCNNPLQADTLYYKTGSELSTVSSTSARFEPGDTGEWRQEQIDLAPYLGKGNLQVNFIGINRYGNNLYLDNIAISAIENEIISPTTVSCDTEPTLMLQVVNDTEQPVSSITFQYSIDNGAFISYDIDLDQPLSGGQSTQVEQYIGTLDVGEHEIDITIDVAGNESQLNKMFYIDERQDILPIRENMENLDASSWLMIGSGSTDWKPVTSNSNTYLMADHAATTDSDGQAWFVSPTLDFSDFSAAILTFDIAYQSTATSSDVLSVLISTDCGQSYSNIAYSKYGSSLKGTSLRGSAGVDWITEEIDLTSYLGNEEVRIAFVTRDYNAGAFLLDDIQVFISEDITVADDILYPNPTINGQFNLNFDLQQKEPVLVSIYRVNGQQIRSYAFENVLNQVYTFDLTDQPDGVYIIKIAGNSFRSVRRLVKLY